MKALSLTQPWATLVVTGEKRIETRSWSTNFTGRVAIHASKGFPKWAKECVNAEFFEESLRRFGYRSPSTLPTGSIIGLATIMGCRRTEDVGHQLSEKEQEFGDYYEGRFAWFLTDPVQFGVPIPCKGALGLWTVPEEIAKALA